MDGCRAATTPQASRSGGRRSYDGGHEELGVFTAERYFNGALAAEDALWCDRSSSSFSSVFKAEQQEGSAPTPTAATSSSEASWNSGSVLLPNPSVVGAPAAAPTVESKLSRTTSEHTGKKPSSSFHLRRWLCVCAGGDGEESVRADLCRGEVDAGPVLGGKKRSGSTEADAMLPRRKSKEMAVEEVTTVRVRPGKWVDDSDPFLAGAAAGHRRAANSGESSMRILNPTTTASSDERWRNSLDMFRPAGQGSTLVSAKQNSALTIVAGSAARGGAASAAGGARGSPDPPHRACGCQRDSGVDDAAPSELIECMYPPSEASVVWSVVTAEGAASGNFSSAASGYYYYNNGSYEEAALGNTAAVKSNRRSSSGRINGSSGLLDGCMSDRAVDAIGPARTSVHRPEVEPAAVARLRAANAGRNRPDVTHRR